MIELVIAYSATSISIVGRIIFMSLLYSKKSTNIYSLIFCIINIISSSMWIIYSQLVIDTPLFVRGTSDLLLFVISASYILHNRHIQNNMLRIEDISNNTLQIP